MPLLESVDLQPEELEAYRRPETRGAGRMRWALPPALLDAEATHTTLGLVSMRDDEALAEVRLDLAVRLRVDDAVHLWSEESRALKAAVVINWSSRSMQLTLTFSPANQPARSTLADALFLYSFARSTHMVLRLPNGSLAPDRLPVPSELALERDTLNYLRLVADISELSGIPVPVPPDPNEEFVKDLVTARKLLRGETVTGQWAEGSFTFDASAYDSLRELLAQGSRHQLLNVASMILDVAGTHVPLGEIRQLMSDAQVVDVTESEGEVTVRVRAHDGEASASMIPEPRSLEDLDPRVEVGDEAFEALLSDLESPPRYTKLRELL